MYFDLNGQLQKFHIIEEIENNLRGMADEKNAAFQRKLTPGIAPERFLGTRVPALRSYAKKLAKQSPDGCMVFLETLPHPYYDEDLLHAILLGGIKEFDRCAAHVEAFLPYIDNWAVCDTLRPAVFKKNTERLLPKVQEWVASKKTYICRFGVGMLLSYYLDERFCSGISGASGGRFQRGILRQYDDRLVLRDGACKAVGEHDSVSAGKPAAGVGAQQDNPEGARKLPDHRRAEGVPEGIAAETLRGGINN